MSTLSNAFRLAWNSYPIICFNRHQNGACPTLIRSEDDIRQTDAFLKHTTDFLRSRSQTAPSGATLQKFSYVFGEVHHNEPTGRHQNHLVDSAINYAIENQVKELILDFVGPRPVSSPNMGGISCRFYPLPQSVMSAGSITLLRLKGLQFTSQEVVFTSPILCSLRIESCDGIRFLRVRDSCENLKTVQVISCPTAPEKIEISAPNLDSFSYSERILFWEGHIDNCEIDILACKSLQHLVLRSSRLSKKWIEQNLSELPLLNTLRLTCCHTLNNLKISHDGLTTVELSDCMKLGNIQINARNLSSFLFKGPPKPTPCFLIYSSAKLKAVIRFPDYFWLEDFNWTLYVTDFLGSFGQCIELKIHVRGGELLTIPEEAREKTYPALCDLKKLYLVIESGNKLEELLEVALVELVDSLLWLSPSVEFISIVSASGEKSLQVWIA